MRLSRPVFALLVIEACLSASPAFTSERVEVPLEQRVLTDGTIRYFIDISLAGSAPIAAMVDTGSTGLRILPGAVTDTAFASISEKASVYGYGSGVRLTGVVAAIGIGLGHITSAEPIPVQLVRTIDCYPKQPHCPASRISQADYRLGGDGLARQGFEAIFGIEMGAGPVDNPLRRLGVKTWIVVLPRPGERRPGALILNPEDGETAGYTLFPIDARLKKLPGGATAHDAIPSCIVVEKTEKRICGPTLLDTGAPGVSIASADAAERSGWRRGERIGIVFRNKEGAEVKSEFRAGAGAPSRIHASAPKNENQTDTRIAAGTLPYFLFSVLYDDERKLVGLRRR
jgi:predicted aspartyl protease